MLLIEHIDKMLEQFIVHLKKESVKKNRTNQTQCSIAFCIWPKQVN